MKGSEKVCGQILLGFEYGYDYGIQSSDASLSDAFFQVMNEYLKPVPKIKPAYLPNGYIFLNGSLVPKSIAVDQTEYQKLVQHLSAKSKMSADGSVLFTEPITWNEANSAMISYIDDTQLKLITILATRMNGQKVDMNIPKNTESQKIVVNKQEVIYIGPNLEFSNKAIWYDSHTDILVSTWDDANSGISKEEFLKMVHSILN
ncbi:uncharacterized protein DUF4367 [Paenibacillus taihuensis]|uniref:Uncharacterized protein DUF4367 n=1 Tax=Paenibacillus taihuensis TaxID=1156355 RepID=A0A3D9QWJ6_9BACL|nr:uncharacterized protein DUF4367 [Paenibacillus taihuensis]